VVEFKVLKSMRRIYYKYFVPNLSPEIGNLAYANSVSTKNFSQVKERVRCITYTTLTMFYHSSIHSGV
jgi:hypothetical protein